MNKIFKFFMVFMMVIIIIIPSFGQKAKKLVIWCTDKEVAGLDPMKKEFKKKEKIDVEIEIQAEVRSKFIQAAKAGTGPDIVVGAHDWVGELAKNGLLAEINLDQSKKAEFFPVSIDGFTYSGKLYGVPYCVEALVLIYNKKLIKDPPKTWEDLIKVAKPMTKGGNYGFLYGIDNNFYNNFPFIGSQGGYIFKNVGGKYDIMDIGLDGPGAIEGAKFIMRLVQEGIVPTSTNNGTVESNFHEGKVAMIMDGPWNIKGYVKTNPEIGVTKLPTLNGKKSVPFVGARGFMINGTSANQKNVDTAKNFIINYAGSEDGQYAMFKGGGRPPAHIKANEKAQKDDPFVKPVIDSANDGIPMPNVKAMAVVWNYAAGMIDKFKTGETTVENSIKAAVQTIRNELSKNPSRFE